MDKLISIERKIEAFLELKADGDDLFFLLWGRTYELEYDLREASWEKLEYIFQIVSRQRNIIYCTNGEAVSAHLNDRQISGGNGDGI